jgi:hypothetical protein
MSNRDMRSMCKLIGIMLILYAPFWMMFRANASELVHTQPHHEHINPYAATSPAKWFQDITIELDATTGPQLRKAVEYAAWQWSQRTGKRISVAAGIGAPGFSTSGKITFRTGYIANANTVAQTDMWHYLDTGNIAGAIVTMSTLYNGASEDCLQYSVTHELGHAIGGIGHTSSPQDVMYSHQTHCRYALTASDTNYAPYDGNSCFVELMKNHSLYIPNYQGHAALLKYTGSGWKLSEYLPAHGTCTTVAAIGMELTFGDIRALSGRYRAQLRYTGNETWTLQYAE